VTLAVSQSGHEGSGRVDVPRGTPGAFHGTRPGRRARAERVGGRTVSRETHGSNPTLSDFLCSRRTASGGILSMQMHTRDALQADRRSQPIGRRAAALREGREVQAFSRLGLHSQASPSAGRHLRPRSSRAGGDRRAVEASGVATPDRPVRDRQLLTAGRPGRSMMSGSVPGASSSMDVWRSRTDVSTLIAERWTMRTLWADKLQRRRHVIKLSCGCRSEDEPPRRAR
jgi:hypothetical protein